MRVCKTSNVQLHIVAVSYAHAQTWQPYYPVNQFIYNGFDFKAIPYSSHHNGTLAFAGRIVPAKESSKNKYRKMRGEYGRL